MEVRHSPVPHEIQGQGALKPRFLWRLLLNLHTVPSCHRKFGGPRNDEQLPFKQSIMSHMPLNRCGLFRFVLIGYIGNTQIRFLPVGGNWNSTMREGLRCF
jgi:hypothetical protein